MSLKVKIDRLEARIRRLERDLEELNATSKS
jgi:hypothetical protein